MRVTRCLLAFVVLAACAPTPKHRLAVAVVVDGDRAKVGEIKPQAVAGLELQPFDVPAAPAKPADESSVNVTKARASYVNGEFEACRNALAEVDLAALLGVGNRSLAARVIAFDAACAFGAQAKSESEVLATKLASLGLDMPDAPLAQDVENLIARAITNAGKAARFSLTVDGKHGGRVSVDGKFVCTLPCKTDVPTGDHYVSVDTDGFMPVARWVPVSNPQSVSFDPQPATPEVAVAQFRDRIGRGLPANDAVGAKLLGRLSSQPRVMLLSGDKRIAGTLIVDGEIRARGEGDNAKSLVQDLAYDGKLLKRPAIWQRPWFWIATSAAVAIAAGIVVYAIYEPNPETEVGF